MLGSGEHISFVEITIEEGHDVPEHVHPHEQAGQVIAGRARFRIGDQETELEQGDSYMIPGGKSFERRSIAETTASSLSSFVIGIDCSQELETPQLGAAP